jgi:hypothetical protein
MLGAFINANKNENNKREQEQISVALELVESCYHTYETMPTGIGAERVRFSSSNRT